jgi:hypothetical protein
MKLFVAFLSFSLSFGAIANALSFRTGDQTILDEKQSVPGDNPLKFCHDPSDFILTIDHVDLAPNPPVPGQKLLIEATGNFTQEVGEGAKVTLTVKYGLITLIHMKTDLCEQIKTLDEECPLNGKKIITKEVDIPSKVPAGKYFVQADVYTVDEHHVTCLEAHVQFQ